MTPPNILQSALIIIAAYASTYMCRKAYEAWLDCKLIELKTEELKRQSDVYHRRTMEMLEFASNLPDMSELETILNENNITHAD